MFAIGWPRVLASAAAGADDPAVALEHDARSGATALVTPTSVEIWSCGRDRRCVGRHARSPEAVLEEGAYLAAKWRDGRSTLAVIAEGGRVHLFDLIFADAPQAPPARGRVGASFDAAPSSAWVPPRPPRSVPPRPPPACPPPRSPRPSPRPRSPRSKKTPPPRTTARASPSPATPTSSSSAHPPVTSCSARGTGTASHPAAASSAEQTASRPPAPSCTSISPPRSDSSSPSSPPVDAPRSLAANHALERRAAASAGSVPVPPRDSIDTRGFRAWKTPCSRASRRTLAARDASRWGREAEGAAVRDARRRRGRGRRIRGRRSDGDGGIRGRRIREIRGRRRPRTDPVPASPPPASASPPPASASPPPASASLPLSSSPSPYSRRWARSAWRIGDTRRVIPGP